MAGPKHWQDILKRVEDFHKKPPPNPATIEEAVKAKDRRRREGDQDESRRRR